MKKRFLKIRTIVVMMMAMIMMALPVCAEESTHTPTPYFNNVSVATITMGFDKNNVVYCGLAIAPYTHGSGVSGLMKLYNSAGTCIAVWPVSDYERPIGAEFTYQGVYGATYTATFEGYAYSNNGTPADRLELSVTGTCVDAD